MNKKYKAFLDGFDMELLATALQNGVKFKETEVRVDINGSGKIVPMVEKVETCKINEKFIEANFEKLLELKIIKNK